MRLGIDFGTTRTVVAAAERGNYPVISFQTGFGDMQQWYPSLIAAHGPQIVCGFEALLRQNEPDWFTLRSFKRLLAEASPYTLVPLGAHDFPVLELVTAYLSHLHAAICVSSNLEPAAGESLDALIAVPANANNNQRFLTLEGFRRAGFRVLGLINEPSAAGIEYAHRYRTKAGAARKEYLVVYDLGGGTFDTAVVRMHDRTHEVLTNEGIAKLGGDDFDEQLLELVLEHAGITSLAPYEQQVLLEECRERKEGLHPNTRKIAVDLGRALERAGEVIIPTATFYEHCIPLVEKSLKALQSAIARTPGAEDMAAVYLVGGSSDFPIVGRTLRQHYGKRVRRSPYPFAATAIGLAIAADAETGYLLQERFTRHFGVWREAEAGERIIFDPVFLKDTPLPKLGEPPLVSSRSYHPAHNVGHLRYLECGDLSPEGQPSGDITPWRDIRFPFDPALRDEPNLEGIPVRRSNGLDCGLVEEMYACDTAGMIEVIIRNQTTGEKRTFHLRDGSESPRSED